jgi:hypothetical protein
MNEHIEPQEVLDEQDWDITPAGLYVATRGFLARRGYCCANKCRNCPYINWRDNSAWRPVPHDYVRETRVSMKAVGGAQMLLQHHQELLQEAQSEEERARQQSYIAHYQFLLDHWKG